MQEVSRSSALASNRTIRRLEHLRESVAHASNIVNRLARDGEQEVGAESEGGAMEEARRRPLPVLPTVNLRAMMARYRRSTHPPPHELPPPPAPPQNSDAEVLAFDEIADPEVVEETETTADSTEDEI